ncbi:MAG: 4Fe-4S dicluster domain-containing protein [Chitinophagaceae bacterium]|nr:4Fe-4S dicluster domain-containing protein [Chitinophagaceae bacterium]
MEDKTQQIKPAKERKVKGRVEIDIQKCKGCELCTNACKEQALSLSETINIKGYHYIIANNDACNGCVNCALVCPDAVITVYRTHPKKKPVDITPVNIKEQLQSLVNPSKQNGL